MGPNSGEKSYRKHLLFLFLLLFYISVKFVFHEMWKDEWQAWQLATKTDSLSVLFSLLPGEGHPALWFLLLRGWNGMFELLLPFTAEWFRLQLFHFLLVAFTFFLLVYRINSSGIRKAFFFAAYFILFEYSVIARPYIILVGLMLLAVIVLQKNSIYRLYYISLILFLLSQTEVYGVFIAASLLVMMVVEKPDDRRRLFLLFAALAAGVVLFYFQVSPGTTTQQSGTEAVDVFRKFADPFQSLTLNTFYPGLTNTVFRSEPGVISLLAGLIILIGLATVFINERKLLFAFISAFVLFYLFGALFFLGGVRNWGLLFVFYSTLLLLSRQGDFSWKGYTILASIMLVNFIHGSNALLSDITGKFSNARNAGVFIASEIPVNIQVIGLNKAFCVGLTGYSGRPLIGMPEKMPYYYFREQDWRGLTYLPDMGELLLMKEYLRTKKIIVVYNKPLEASRFPLLKPLAKFDEPSLRNENYYFYHF